MTDERPKRMTVDDIVAQWLAANNYDGLFSEDGECGCVLEDLAPCGEMQATCAGGFRGPCRCGDHFQIYATKAKAEEAEQAEEEWDDA